jgi:hypothetical protein
MKLKLIVAHNGDETAFVVKPTTTFDKVRNVVGKKYGLEPGQIRLYSDSGERCAETNTPKMMEMMAGRTYQLRVEMQQLGGGQ